MNEVDVTSVVAYVFMRALNRQVSLSLCVCVYKMTLECVSNSSPRKIVVNLYKLKFDTTVWFVILLYFSCEMWIFDF